MSAALPSFNAVGLDRAAGDCRSLYDLFSAEEPPVPDAAWRIVDPIFRRAERAGRKWIRENTKLTPYDPYVARIAATLGCTGIELILHFPLAHVRNAHPTPAGKCAVVFQVHESDNFWDIDAAALRVVWQNLRRRRHAVLVRRFSAMLLPQKEAA